MGIFTSENPKEKQHSGILGAFAVDVIKWEPESEAEASILVHKYEYEDFASGTPLIVGPSQMAIFTNNVNQGTSHGDGYEGESQFSVFVGPCKIKLDTKDIRFAPFRNVAHKLTGGESAYHSTVYFVNTTYLNDLSWGTQAPVVVVDPEEEVNVHVRAFGMFGVHIERENADYARVQAKKILQRVVGTRADYTRDDLIKFMRAKILEYIPNLLANSIINKNISVLKISAYLTEFSETIAELLRPHFTEFGLTLDHFSIQNINVPDEDLQSVNESKIARKKARLEAEGNAERMDIESEALARKRVREGYSYQDERSFDVFKSAAENEGTAATMMGGAMGLGMGFGIGDAFGAGVSNMARNTFSKQENTSNAQTKICPSCSAVCVAEAKFCLNCGEKFQADGIKCPDCGTVLPEGAKFCLNCGFKLMLNCPNCGISLPPGAKFCPDCGTKMA